MGRSAACLWILLRLLCTWIGGMSGGSWGVSRRWKSCESMLDGGRGRLVASSGD